MLFPTLPTLPTLLEEGAGVPQEKGAVGPQEKGEKEATKQGAGEDSFCLPSMVGLVVAPVSSVWRV